MLNQHLTVNVSEQTQDDQSKPYFLSRKGDIPFFDHPLMIGHKLRHNKAYPYTSSQEVLGALKRGNIDEEDIQIIKMVGDSIAVHEGQFRRIMKKAGYSASQTSKKLDDLRRNGYVERWKCRLEHDVDEEIKPPAPFTLGLAGYLLLRELYPDKLYMKPDSLLKQGGAAPIQRYVSLNEMRTTFAELGLLRDWRWNHGVNYNRHIPTVTAVAELETPKGNVHFLMERTQMGQNFAGYMKSKLHKWKKAFEANGELTLNRMKVPIPIIVIYCSTYEMAKYLHQEVMLDQFPFNIWVCVEEDYIEDGGYANSFYEPVGESLKAFQVPFLKSHK